MRMNQKCAIAGLTIVVVSALGAAAANAQSVITPFVNSTTTTAPTLLEKFDKAFYGNDPDYFRNRSVGRQLNFLVGPRFPETEIAADGQAIVDLYRDTMSRQLSAGPIMRTADLQSPFNQSIRTMPSVAAGSFGPTMVQPPVLEPSMPSSSPKAPVPALW